MNLYRLSGAVAALLCTAAISTDAKVGMSQQVASSAPTAINEATQNELNQSAQSAPAPANLNAAVPLNPPTAKPVANAKPTEASVVKIHNHAIQGQPAATLYVRNLPILTFLDAPSTAQTARPATQLVTNSSNPAAMTKAAAIAEQLNQIYQDGVAADGIKVIWQGDKASSSKPGQYVVKAGQLPIATIDATTTYAKTTSNAEQDALLVANRLRQLLSKGNATPKPLQQVEGKPARQRDAAGDDGSAWNVTRTYRGEASWYGPGFHGNLTANGERFNQDALTAAHPSLPFGTRVRVTNQYNGRSVIVRINDRGPYAGDRIIDLSAGSADVIGLTDSGVAPVAVEVLSR
jgi:rare lipoprotein A